MLAAQVQHNTVIWSLAVWPCRSSILVVRESNISPWISLFFFSILFLFISLSRLSLLNSVSRVCPWPWHSPLFLRVSAPSCTHVTTRTHTLTNACAYFHIPSNADLFSLPDTHAHTTSRHCWAISRMWFCFLRAQQWPLWILTCSLLIYISSCLPLSLSPCVLCFFFYHFVIFIWLLLLSVETANQTGKL